MGKAASVRAEEKSGQAIGHRPEFLIAMYEQLMGDINRHIVVVWQTLGVLAASIAALVLAEQQHVPTAYAVILVLLVSSWAIEHVHDSNYWYNRNLVMITNIERVFLTNNDLSLIHPYFGKHRESSSFLAHLEIQRRYVLIMAFGSLLYFGIQDVWPTLDVHNRINFLKWLPFLAIGALVHRDWERKKHYDKKYADYLAISPGIEVAAHIDYGNTHGA